MVDHPALRAARSVFAQQLRDTKSFVVRAGESIENAPAAGSGRDRLYRWLDTLPQKIGRGTLSRAAAWAIVEAGFDNVVQLTASALDHAEALELCLFSDDGLAMSPNTVARGLLEAALQICFILDPNVPAVTTLLRAAAFQLAAVEGGEQTARLFEAQRGGAERLETNAEAVDGIHEWLELSGIERRTKSPGTRQTQSLRIGPIGVSLEFDATACAKKYLPDSPYVYAVLSGAAHSRGWFIGSVFGVSEPDSGTPLWTNYAACVLTTLAIADALTKAFGAHLGADTDPELKATHKRRTMLIRIGDPDGDDLALDHREYHATKRKSAQSAMYSARFGSR